MHKYMTMFEDVWVAVAFAEAGEYAAFVVHDLRLHFRQPVRAHV